MMTLLAQLKPEHISENLPKDILSKYQLMSRYEAIKNIHLPSTLALQTTAVKRLKFEELFLIQLVTAIKNYQKTGSRYLL